MSIKLRILGPLDVVDITGSPQSIGANREAELLAALLLPMNQVVSSGRLIEDLWPGDAPEGAAHALRVYISRLRKVLRDAGHDGALVTRPPGYVLRVEPHEFDATTFETLLSKGRAQAALGDHTGACDHFQQALDLWRGPALAGVRDAPFAHAEAVRLDEARVGALEARIEADIYCGRHAQVVGELEALTRLHPLREQLWYLRILALYRSGRQAEALRAYQDLRKVLADDLGLQPSPALARLESAVLTHESQLDWLPLRYVGPGPDEGRAATPPPAVSIDHAPTTRYARSGDARIAYQVVGEGPIDVVLVPGFVSNLDVYWENPGWTAIFDRLTTFARLILWDKRGTGLSDPVQRVPALDERAEDLLAVMDAAGSQRPSLFGISEGGPMSLLFAATYPERVRSLLLYGISPRFSTAPDWDFGWTPAEIQRILADLDEHWGEGALLYLFAPSRMDDEPVRHGWGRTQRLGASPGMGRAVMEAMVATDCRHILPSIHVPTMLLHRRGDRVADVEAARYAAKLINGAQIVEFPGDNHVITLGDLNPILDQMETFFTTTDHAVSVDWVLATVLFLTIGTGDGGVVPTPGSGHPSSGAIMRQAVMRFHGQLLQSTGATLVATFAGPSRAIACACAIRSGLASLGIGVEAGIHTGEWDMTRGQVSDTALQTVRSVARQAGPGEVLVTATVKDLVAGSDIAFTPRGNHHLRQLSGDSTLYAVQ